MCTLLYLDHSDMYIFFTEIACVFSLKRKRRELIDRGLTILSPEETLEQAVAYHAYTEASAWMNELAKVSGLESRLYHFITVLLHSQPIDVAIVCNLLCYLKS